jgi:Arc/MetJ-type ribon-helix-helix transcriptional regulator
MKNITVSVDDEVYHRARIKAALLQTSVSALVRKSLEELAGEETEFERLRAKERAVRERISARSTTFFAADRLSRDEVHDRHALS